MRRCKGGGAIDWSNLANDGLAVKAGLVDLLCFDSQRVAPNHIPSEIVQRQVQRGHLHVAKIDVLTDEHAKQATAVLVRRGKQHAAAAATGIVHSHSPITHQFRHQLGKWLRRHVLTCFAIRYRPLVHNKIAPPKAAKDGESDVEKFVLEV